MNHRTTFMILLLICSWRAPTLQALDQKTARARIEHLRQMSEIERGRFDRNLQEFQRLSEADKQRYRKFHEDLNNESTQGGGLSKLLQTYAVWVQTLTPTQRDELQKETVLSQKLALIRRFKDEQDEPSESHDQHLQADSHSEEAAPQVISTINKREAFLLKDLKAVMAVLVARLSEEKMRSEFNEPHLAEYIPIIQVSVQSNGGNYLEWPSEMLLKDMTAALSKESVQLVNRSDYKSRRDAIVRFLLMGIMKQAREAVHFPTDAEKSQILLEGLIPEERERVMNLPRDRREGYLVRKSVELKGGDAMEAFKKLPEYHGQVGDLFQRFEISPPAKFIQRTKKGNERPPEPRGEGKRPPLNRPNRNPGDK